MSSASNKRFSFSRPRKHAVTAAIQLCLITAVASLGLHSRDARAQSAPVQIPRDEAPHNAGIEWWYYTGHLSGKDVFGVTHNYGFQTTYFRVGEGTFPVASVYLANMAVTDLNRGTHTNDTRISVQPDLLLPGGGYNIQLQDWNINARNGSGAMSGGFLSLDYTFSLGIHATTPVILNGDQGVMPPNATGALDYYSFVNEIGDGTIIDHGLPVHVTGTVWFDHEFGTPNTTPVGWRWYAIELDDGTKYNISVLKDAQNATVASYGTYIAADGSYSKIDPAALSDRDLGPTWTSPRTGATYPTAEVVAVPGGQVTVTARVNDQEMTLLGPNLASFAPLLASLGVSNLNYWEGDSKVTGVVNGKPVSGKAYMEIKPFGTL